MQYKREFRIEYGFALNSELRSNGALIVDGFVLQAFRQRGEHTAPAYEQTTGTVVAQVLLRDGDEVVVEKAPSAGFGCDSYSQQTASVYRDGKLVGSHQYRCKPYTPPWPMYLTSSGQAYRSNGKTEAAICHSSGQFLESGRWGYGQGTFTPLG